jgi:hypothetical protein
LVSDIKRLRVFVNRVPRGIFGLKIEKVAESWRKLHNEELHSLYSSPSIIRMIKTRRMRSAGHIGYRRKSQRVRDQYEDQGVGGWIILNRILER